MPWLIEVLGVPWTEPIMNSKEHMYGKCKYEVKSKVIRQVKTKQNKAKTKTKLYYTDDTIFNDYYQYLFMWKNSIILNLQTISLG